MMHIQLKRNFLIGNSGTAAVTTRGLKEVDMLEIVELIDEVIANHENEARSCKSESECYDGWQTFVCVST